jgi:predicted dehydrogenase
MSEQKAIRAGLVGCGAIAQKALIPGFLPPGHPRRVPPPHFLDFGGCDGLAIVAVADSDSERLREAQTTLDARAFTDVAVMLDTMSLDALIVAVPNRLHTHLATVALARGLDVFLEKPLATSPAELDALISALSTTDRLVMVHLPWLYAGLTRQLVRECQQLTSPIEEIDATFCHSGPSQTWSKTASWYREPSENPGGCISDLGLHLFSIIAELAMPQPLAVQSYRAQASGTVPEHAEWLVSAGSTRVRASVGWTAPSPLFTVRVSSAGRCLQLNLTGEGKGLYAGVDEASLERAIRAQARLILPVAHSVSSPYSDFVRAVQTRAEPLASARRLAEIERLCSVFDAKTGVKRAAHSSSAMRFDGSVAPLEPRET